MSESAEPMPPAQAAEFAALEARAAETEPEAAPGAAPGSSGEPAPAVMEWGYAAAGIVGMFAVYADNWELTRDEQGALASHLAAALEAWFPNVALDARFQAAAGLVMVAGGVAMSRIDTETRSLRPLRRPQAEPAKAAEKPA